MKGRVFRIAVCILAVAATPIRADDPPPVPASVAVHPPAITLRHPRQPQSLQVTGASADGYSLDLRDQARFTSADPKIAAVDERGWVRPIAGGQTKIAIIAAGQTREVPVIVQLPPAAPSTSFRHEVMPILSQAGCNTGACHGYSLGKNGFKLSLRGPDPDLDYFSIAREFSSRRINPLAPDASLMLAKPLGEAPHEGGVRFQRGSLAHQTMREWIEEGAPDDLKDPARVAGVRMIPEKLVLRPGQQHRLQLMADYSDGTVRDVTRLAVFTANNEQYAGVTEDGLIRAGLAGETAVVARFELKFAATNIIVLQPSAGFTPTPVPQDHFIDRHVVTKLNRLKIAPSPLSGDEEFLRRVYLDLIGVQPKPDELKAFLGDKDAKKRDKVVEALFARPEFVDHWSLKWGDLLSNSRNSVSQPSVFLFREFIRGAVAANMPLDDFARRLLTAKGGIVDDPASVYLAISKDTNETIERTTQVFCGVRMLCARCHSHPMENWTQADYYGLASFFSQVSTRPDSRYPNVGNTKVVQVNLQGGPATNPRSKQPQPAKFLGGAEPKLKGAVDRPDAYARWLTAPENPYFARGLVNRLWSYFFHRGIIDPVDDIRSTNPPVNPELLDALTKDFVAHKFDARHLMRRIVTSATYQRTSAPNDSNRHDEQNFSHAIPRRIPAEALLDSLVQATGVPENIGGAPAGFRAAQLPDANIDSDFLKLFGKPQRMDACECERDNGSNMLQALHFINGKSILGRVQNPNARPALLLREPKITDERLVTELFLWSLARNPNPAELKVSVDFMKSHADKRGEAAQDLMWALLNSRDFLMVH